ncbi:inorganic triphosphatase [Paraburkholderia hospita]|uniref:CYTH domain-containing protein n=1 Tax=Paraburkholderia hospita TaxID=169430 RepID=UPI001F1929B5|nr:CYTH domain-containing protein [Paraburkholderia hospita]
MSTRSRFGAWLLGRGSDRFITAYGEERIQTLKLESAAQAGLFDRDEFEMTVESDVPNLKLLQDQISGDSECCRLIRDEATVSRLKPIFVTRIKRSAFPLRLPSGDELEIALDEGSVDAELGSVPITAVELELKGGQPESLYGVALEMLDLVPLRIDRISKADLGYGMLIDEHREPVKAQPVQLKQRDSVEDAFCSIACNCLD